MTRDFATLRIHEVLVNARGRGASDVHFGIGERVAIRIDGRLIVLEGSVIPQEALRGFLETILDAPALRRFAECGSADSALRSESLGPCRVHAFRQQSGVRIAVRLLAQSIPELSQLDLPPVIASFTQRAMGLVLFTGPTGSGKTTALAAFVDAINRSAERNIITIEDPIEYVHDSIRSPIAQCEIGRDASGFAEALRGSLRADPDVIVIGEMRDRETMAAALTAAETGHLVLATLHTNDTAQTVDRIIDSFPSAAQNQLRAQLAAVLVAIVGMRLVSRRAASGRRAATEILVATEAVRNLIRESKTHQLRNAMLTGREAGMQTLETHLSTLVGRAEITLEAAQATANRPLELRALQWSAV